MRSNSMRRVRLSVLIGLSIALAALPGPLAPAPAGAPHAVLSGACYCRAAGDLTCVGVLTRAECDKRCAEELCDDWFWMERLTCWNWGYGG